MFLRKREDYVVVSGVIIMEIMQCREGGVVWEGDGRLQVEDYCKLFVCV